jgi:type I restriction enzyme R subunit
MITDINSEDRLVQSTFADHLQQELGWDSVYAWNQENFGPESLLGRADTREVVLKRDLRQALVTLNPQLPVTAVDETVTKLSYHDFTRSLLQHNQAFYKMIRDGVPVSYREPNGALRHAQAQVIDFRDSGNNRFLVVRELKLTGLRTPNYNRRADLICFVNGLPLVFIELKAVYKNIRAGFDGNLKDYLDEHVIGHAFHHNAFLIVSNGHRARYGSITSEWDHFGEWKRLDEQDKGNVDAEVLLNGMLDKERLLDILENFILFDTSKPGAVRKVVARNHQVMGVNCAIESVINQEELKIQFPLEERLKYKVIELPLEQATDSDMLALMPPEEPKTLQLPMAAHPDLGKLGVFWHTQGSGKSYSMAFFAEKVRRTIPGNFTFVLMTDRNDLDSQIYRTFVGCGVADEQTPRAGSGKELEQLLKENHRYIFSAYSAGMSHATTSNVPKKMALPSNWSTKTVVRSWASPGWI